MVFRNLQTRAIPFLKNATRWPQLDCFKYIQHLQRLSLSYYNNTYQFSGALYTKINILMFPARPCRQLQ